MAATKHSLPEAEVNGSSDTARPSKKLKVKDVSADTHQNDNEEKLRKKKKKDKKEKERKNRDKKSEASEEQVVQEAEEDKVVEDEEPKKKKKKKDKQRQTESTISEGANTSNLNESPVIEEEEKSKKRKDKKKDRNQDKKKGSTEQTSETNGTASASGQFYVQSAALGALPQSEIDSFLQEHSITVTDPKAGSKPLRPIIDFDYLPATDLLKKSPFSAYKTPTPIQAASWPFTLLRRDVIGVAETGSGKTMAFALPCIEALSTIRKRCVKAVVVSPTRELAMQTHVQMVQLGSLVGLKCVCLYGGASKEEQRLLLQRGADIIVATPGRLKDFMSDGTVVLKDAQFVVLDEADRMLDKGFEDDIKDILSSTPPREQRQTLMFTATWPASVQALASSFMVDPVKITIGSSGKETSGGAVELQANSRIVQRVEVLDPRSKEQRLLQLLKQYQQGSKKDDRILVFCLYKKEATRVEGFLSQRGVRVTGIHGDLRQEQRTRSLEAFKAGTTPVLVATDVAARGLDIPEVKLVINVTFPLTIEDYVHRIGRTGRAGKVGEAITFFTEQDKTHSGSLINILKGANQPVPEELLKFGTTVKKKAHGTYGAFFKDVDMTQKATKIVFDD